MTTTLTSRTPLTLPETAPAAARAVFRLLREVRFGTLDVQLPDGTQMHFGSLAEGEPRAALRLLDWSVCSAALRSGDIGFAEAFLDGRPTCPRC
jgi:cyclopropane-fatty-acyl-phospholipid synthase